MNGETGNGKYSKFLAVSKLILLALIIAGIPAFLYLKYGAEIFSKDAAERVADYLRANSSTAAILIVCIQIIQVVICFLPGQPVQFGIPIISPSPKGRGFGRG